MLYFRLLIVSAKIRIFSYLTKLFLDFFSNFAHDMKNFITFIVILATFTACQESLEDRCQRECVTYTQKHCPLQVDKNIVMDSMFLDRPSHTINYAYTVSGPIDDAAILTRNNPREHLLVEVKNSTHLKRYKEAGYNFRYVYYSGKKKGTQLFEATFRPADYQ